MTHPRPMGITEFVERLTLATTKGQARWSRADFPDSWVLSGPDIGLALLVRPDANLRLQFNTGGSFSTFTADDDGAPLTALVRAVEGWAPHTVPQEAVTLLETIERSDP